MQISKRNGTVEAYEAGKIKRAMGAAFASVGTVLDDDEADRLIARIERAMASAEQGEGGSVSVEDVQDLVERALMEANHYEELKSYILYREDRARKRAARERLCAQLRHRGAVRVGQDHAREPYGPLLGRGRGHGVAGRRIRARTIRWRGRAGFSSWVGRFLRDGRGGTLRCGVRGAAVRASRGAGTVCHRRAPSGGNLSGI